LVAAGPGVRGSGRRWTCLARIRSSPAWIRPPPALSCADPVVAGMDPAVAGPGVHVMEAWGLPAIYTNGSSDPYMRLQRGRPRATTMVKRSLSHARVSCFPSIQICAFPSIHSVLLAASPASQQYFSLTPNQHQPPATSHQPNREYSVIDHWGKVSIISKISIFVLLDCLIFFIH